MLVCVYIPLTPHIIRSFEQGILNAPLLYSCIYNLSLSFLYGLFQLQALVISLLHENYAGMQIAASIAIYESSFC